MTLERLLIAFAILLTVVAVPSQATPDVNVDWTDAIQFETGGGLVNPAVLVGFNPQPEPPGDALVDVTDPTAPVLSWDTDVADFRILLGIGGDARSTDPTGTPNDVGHYEFEVLGRTTDYLVSFDLMTSTGGVPNPGSWVGFNPQPEPPVGGVGVGFDFSFTSSSIASLRVQIEDIIAEKMLTFSLPSGSAPEPSSLLLAGLGLALVFSARRGH